MRILNSEVFNFSTTVLAIRPSLRDAANSERAQADRSPYHVGRFNKRAFAHCGSPGKRKISYTGRHLAECGTAVPFLMPFVIQRRAVSKPDKCIHVFSTNEATLFNRNPLQSANR